MNGHSFASAHADDRADRCDARRSRQLWADSLLHSGPGFSRPERSVRTRRGAGLPGGDVPPMVPNREAVRLCGRRAEDSSAAHHTRRRVASVACGDGEGSAACFATLIGDRAPKTGNRSYHRCVEAPLASGRRSRCATFTLGPPTRATECIWWSAKIGACRAAFSAR